MNPDYILPFMTGSCIIIAIIHKVGLKNIGRVLGPVFQVGLAAILGGVILAAIASLLEYAPTFAQSVYGRLALDTFAAFIGCTIAIRVARRAV